MVRRWRLRNKLIFGLVLVLGSIGLLALAAWQGLSTYAQSMGLFESKLVELQKLDDLKPEVYALVPREGAREWDKPQFLEQIDRVDAALRQFKNVYAWKAATERDLALIPAFSEKLERFREGVNTHFRQATVSENLISAPSVPSIREPYQALVLLVDQIRSHCITDMNRRASEAQEWYRRCVWVIGLALMLACILLVTLVSLCLHWLIKPVAELQSGVQRVTEGRFDAPIRLQSGDELEELANAFNVMSERIHNTYRDLEEQIQIRSRQLVKSERMVSVGFLAAGVSHEINNPLASIAFCSEALQSRLADYLRTKPEDGEVIKKYLAMIQQEAFRCKEITSRLLEFSRVGERKRESTDIAGLIQSVLEIAQHLQNCRGKRIIFQPHKRLIAQINAQDVKSVVLNLVVNALDSMEEGGVLTIHMDGNETLAEMTFTDSGCGMRPEILKHIFEPFFTRSKTGKGTGLGLFISQQIVDQHGGEIFATSDGPGKGSTFRVRLPLKAVAQAPAGDIESMDADLYQVGNPRKTTRTTGMEDGLGYAA